MTRVRTWLMSAVCAGLVFSGVPAPVHAETIKVLILGDSVASVLRWSPPTMKAFWKGPYQVTLEVWGCQKLVDPGCLEGTTAQPSTLQLIQKHRNEGFDIVVVAAGYNDSGAPYLQNSIRRIHSAVTAMGAHLMWLTYRQNGNVRVKARAFNQVVKAQAKKLKFSVMDWELIARKQKHWFNGDGVHMNAHGGIRLANHIRRALDAYTSGKPVSTTTIAPTTTTLAPPSS